jgi:O-antigen/teichoic acid export membrane protein
VLGTVLRKAGWLGIGTALGQGVVLVATPWLARAYGPEAFGVLALLITVSNISIATGCARFDLALPSCEDEDVSALLRLCLLVGLGVALVTGLAAMLADRLFDLAGPARAIMDQPFLLAGCVFFAAAFQATSSGLLRRGQIVSMAALRIVQGGAFASLALFGGIGLLWSQALSFLPALLYAPFLLGSPRDGKVTIGAAASKYRVFALLGLPGAVLDVVGYSLCIWIVTAAYGASASGELSQVQRIVGAPLMLASISLGQILLRHTAEMRDDLPTLRHLVGRLLALMGGGALIALIALAFVGEPVLAWLLGSRWHVESVTIVAVSVAVFVRAIVSPVSALLATFRRFDLALRWQILYFVCAATLFTLASNALPFHWFVVFYAAHEAVLYGIYLRLISIVLRK